MAANRTQFRVLAFFSTPFSDWAKIRKIAYNISSNNNDTKKRGKNYEDVSATDFCSWLVISCSYARRKGRTVRTCLFYGMLPFLHTARHVHSIMSYSFSLLSRHEKKKTNKSVSVRILKNEEPQIAITRWRSLVRNSLQGIEHQHKLEAHRTRDTQCDL